MMDGITGRAAAMAERRAEALRAAIAAADLPPGITAAREGDDVIVRGRDMVGRLAFDPRMAALGPIARNA